ncbi:MAG: FtsX-like permease family protein [Luteitalea sp.]|nr:FtsX-like permease family protein [Luteitalea sp.]
MKSWMTFGIAFEALRRNVMRSGLTALGVIIGVGAVIVMMAIGDGASASIQARLASMGTNVVTITAGSLNAGGVRLGQGATSTLTPADADALREVPGVQGVSPGVSTRAQVVTTAANWSTQVQGAGADLPVIRAWPLEQGSFFTDADVARAAKFAVLGASVRDELFGAGSDPIGATIRINKQPFKVVGVLARKGQSPMGQDQDDTVIVPFTAAQKRLLGVTHLSNITLSVADGESALAVSELVAGLLRQRHRLVPGEDDDFMVRTYEEMASVLTSTTTTMTYLLASVAAISLLVGGIGIMNIMLVSVTERTREVGLRLSIGARRRDVLRQFLAEALTLCLAGGAAGVLLGVVVSASIGQLLSWSIVISPTAVALSFACAASIGVFFGWYPARRAAGLNPIEALRYE